VQWYYEIDPKSGFRYKYQATMIGKPVWELEAVNSAAAKYSQLLKASESILNNLKSSGEWVARNPRLAAAVAQLASASGGRLSSDLASAGCDDDPIDTPETPDGGDDSFLGALGF
jgi:hypothetical protein